MRVLVIILCAINAALAPVADPAECRWTDGPITIDGRADEPA